MAKWRRLRRPVNRQMKHSPTLPVKSACQADAVTISGSSARKRWIDEQQPASPVEPACSRLDHRLTGWVSGINR